MKKKHVRNYEQTNEPGCSLKQRIANKSIQFRYEFKTERTSQHRSKRLTLDYSQFKRLLCEGYKVYR